MDKIKSAIAILVADLCAPYIAVAKMAIHIGFGGSFTIRYPAIRKGTLNNIYYVYQNDGYTSPHWLCHLRYPLG